ncbi:MAG: cupredoxin domain-containing protein [Gemmatimonadaceae bacterium]
MPHVRASWMATAALIALVACGGGSSGGTEPPVTSGGGGGGGAGVTVTVRNNTYSPAAASVARNGTVTWQWDSCTGDGYGGQTCTLHSVTFDDGGPSAAARDAGSFQRTFPTAGTYTYYCSTHGQAVMSGSVTVP